MTKDQIKSKINNLQTQVKCTSNEVSLIESMRNAAYGIIDLADRKEDKLYEKRIKLDIKLDELYSLLDQNEGN